MNKKDLFKSYTLATGEVTVPNWGEEPVRIQELSAAAIDQDCVLWEKAKN